MLTYGMDKLTSQERILSYCHVNFWYGQVNIPGTHLELLPC